MDDNDAAGSLSNSSEGYADIAGIYRLQASCVGHGFFQTLNDGCGLTVDGTGFNTNEAQQGAAHCDTDCSGVRDADYLKHTPNTPDTALGFVCTSCLTGSGPCGRQVHCAAAPTRQSAWDFVARDLQSAPFSLDSQTAFIVANRLFYQGSGNIGAWHSCTCGGTSTGCGATNGYMQWLTADDDNGNLNDGTPHMTAIFNAFNRHGIACATPAALNSGCGAGPSRHADARGHGRQLPVLAVVEQRGGGDPLLGVPRPRVTPAATSARPRSPRSPARPSWIPRWPTAAATPTTWWRRAPPTPASAAPATA